MMHVKKDMKNSKSNAGNESAMMLTNMVTQELICGIFKTLKTRMSRSTRKTELAPLPANPMAWR
jgi:hypothetical protein